MKVKIWYDKLGEIHTNVPRRDKHGRVIKKNEPEEFSAVSSMELRLSSIESKLNHLLKKGGEG